MSRGGLAGELRPTLLGLWIIAQGLLVALSISAPEGWGGLFVLAWTLTGLFLLLVPGSIVLLTAMTLLGIDVFARSSFDWLLAGLWVVAAGLAYLFWGGFVPAANRYLDRHWPSELFYSRYRKRL
jgi:hypothetical protein